MSYGDDFYGGDLYGGGSGSSEEETVYSYVIGGAVSDTVAYGPTYLTDANGNPFNPLGEQILPLRLSLVSESAMGTEISDLANSFSRSFQDENCAPGSATFAVANTDPDVAQVLTDRLVNFYVYGQIAFTMLIETLNRVAVTANEEHDQITVASGRGHIAMWERAVMYPSRGVDSLPIEDDRVFNWTSPVYNHQSWGFAKSLSIQGTWTPSWTFYGVRLPVEWPDPNAQWIWHSSGTLTWAKPGTCYFRKNFTVPAGTTQIVIYYVGDNSCRLFLDGVPIAEQPEDAFDRTNYIVVDVTPGPHTLAAEVNNRVLPGAGAPTFPPAPVPVTYTVKSGDTLWDIAHRYYGNGSKWRVIYDKNQAQIQADAQAAGLWNPYDPGHWIFPGQVFTIPGISKPAPGPTPIYNPGALLCSVFKWNGSDPVGSPIARSNSTWRILGYPPDVPGMTPGQVIRLALAEAKQRGGMAGWSLAFTDKVDSGGNAWPVVPDIATKVGTDYLTFLTELSATYVDFWAAPGTKRLYAWRRGMRGSNRPITLRKPTNPDDPYSGNMYELAHTRMV